MKQGDLDYERGKALDTEAISLRQQIADHEKRKLIDADYADHDELAKLQAQYQAILADPGYAAFSAFEDAAKAGSTDSPDLSDGQTREVVTALIQDLQKKVIAANVDEVINRTAGKAEAAAEIKKNIRGFEAGIAHLKQTHKAVLGL